MKYIKYGIIIVFLLTTLTSCWSNKDITEIALVVGAAIDKADDGEVEVTAQIVKPSAIKPSGEGSYPSQKGYVNISAKGETLYDAVRNLLSISNRRPYWGYNQLLVISDAVASEGLSDYLDFFERDHEMRQKAYVLIAKGMKAKTVLDSESHIEKLPATHDVSSLESIDSFSKSLKITLLDLLKDFNQDGLGVVIPILYPEKFSKELSQENLTLKGSAIINKDKLVGYLDPIQTRGFLYTQNKVKSTIITIPSTINKKKKIAIEIIRTNSDVIARMENGTPVLNIEVESDGNIGELQEDIKITDLKQVDEIEHETENKIKQEILDAINVTQKDFNSDIFNFIGKINKNYYNEWQRLSGNWSAVYSKTPVNVKVKFTIRRAGLIDESSEFK